MTFRKVLLAMAVVVSSAFPCLAKEVTVILNTPDGKYLDLSFVLGAAGEIAVGSSIGANLKQIGTFSVVEGKYVVTAKIPKGTTFLCVSITSKGWYFHNEDFGDSDGLGCRPVGGLKKKNGVHTIEMLIKDGDAYTALRSR